VGGVALGMADMEAKPRGRGNMSGFVVITSAVCGLVIWVAVGAKRNGRGPCPQGSRREKSAAGPNALPLGSIKQMDLSASRLPTPRRLRGKKLQAFKLQESGKSGWWPHYTTSDREPRKGSRFGGRYVKIRPQSEIVPVMSVFGSRGCLK